MSRYITIDTPPTALDSNGLPYQRLDAPLAAFGGNDAAALGQFSNALDRNVASYRDQLRQQQQLLAHESAANDALTGFRLGAVQAGREFTGLRMKDAVDGHDGYVQAITQSRDDAIQDLPGPARTLLKPHLDRAFNIARQLGLDHQMQQDHAWSDQSSLDSLDADAQEAVLHRNNPDQVQALADRAIGEWAKIGERKGWDDNTVQQLANQSNGRLYGAVIDQHLRDGNLEGAQTVLRKSQPHLDPDTLEWLRQKVAAGGANGDAITPDGTLAGGAGQVDPRLVQLADSSGTNPAAGTTMSDAPIGVMGGQQQAQLPDGGAPQPAPRDIDNSYYPNGSGNVNPKLVQLNGGAKGQQFAQTTTPGKIAPAQTPDGKIGFGEIGTNLTTDGEDSNDVSVTLKNKKHPYGIRLDRETTALTGKKVVTSPVTSRTDTTSSFRTSDVAVSPVPLPRPDPIEGNVPDKFEQADYTNADRALRNVHWYWNIANVHNDHWLGSTPGETPGFDRPEYGVRANFRNVLQKIPSIANMKADDRRVKYLPPAQRNNLTALTMRNIGLQWLTLRGKSIYEPNDKDTEKTIDNLDNWVAAVSRWSGLDPDATLNPDDVNQMFVLLRGMNYAEKGFQTVSDEALRKGIKMVRERNDDLPEKSEDEKRREFLDTALRSPLAGPTTKNLNQRNVRSIIIDKSNN